MVVLAASIVHREGRIVLSRLFREMPRSRIEGLLAAFPRLVDSGTQHTTIETEDVRYVYQPLDELYIVLITNRASNILQDIDSLHLFSQIVSSICKSNEERDISRHSFELLSAFDEVMALGYRENLSLQQIHTFLEMRSHQAQVYELLEQEKRKAAEAAAIDAAKRISAQKLAEAQAARAAMGAGSGMGGMGMGAGFGGPRPGANIDMGPGGVQAIQSSPFEESRQAAAPKPKRGMQLGPRKKERQEERKLLDEEDDDE
ncbi:coatomer subunit delta [Pyronema omphalodes]|nr:coatomer subunit delta [Pyronema omphalodes]